MIKLETKKVSFLLPMNTFIAVEELSAKRLVTPSELIREYINKGLSVDATLADLDNIRSNIRAELESYLKPQVERIIKCVIKGGIASSAGYYLNAKAISSFVPSHMQSEYESALMESKKLGVAHMQVRDRRVDEFMKESEDKLDNKI